MVSRISARRSAEVTIHCTPLLTLGPCRQPCVCRVQTKIHYLSILYARAAAKWIDSYYEHPRGILWRRRSKTKEPRRGCIVGNVIALHYSQDQQNSLIVQKRQFRSRISLTYSVVPRFSLLCLCCQSFILPPSSFCFAVIYKQYIRSLSEKVMMRGDRECVEMIKFQNHPPPLIIIIVCLCVVCVAGIMFYKHTNTTYYITTYLIEFMVT